MFINAVLFVRVRLASVGLGMGSLSDCSFFSSWSSVGTMTSGCVPTLKASSFWVGNSSERNIEICC